MGFTLAFNTIGWQPQDLLFNLIGAILGDPLLADEAFSGETPAQTTALIIDSTITVVAGGVRVLADHSALLNATLSNAAVSESSAIRDTTGKGVGGMAASNKVSARSTATVERSQVTARDAVEVEALDNSGIYANILVVTSSTTSNDGGASVVQGAVNDMLNADHRSDQGTRDVKFGDTVRIGDGYLTEDYSSGDVAALVAGQLVRVADGYADANCHRRVVAS